MTTRYCERFRRGHDSSRGRIRHSSCAGFIQWQRSLPPLSVRTLSAVFPPYSSSPFAARRSDNVHANELPAPQSPLARWAAMFRHIRVLVPAASTCSCIRLRSLDMSPDADTAWRRLASSLSLPGFMSTARSDAHRFSPVAHVAVLTSAVALLLHPSLSTTYASIIMSVTPVVVQAQRHCAPALNAEPPAARRGTYLG